MLVFNDLKIAHSDGHIVIKDTNTAVAKGERILIVGESGSGKSTLFRAVAGLWPWGSGGITHPVRETMMFMPQRPYLPLGQLRAAITYPSPANKFKQEEIEAALKRCGLEHLIERLDETEKWERILSIGEQQRVQFCRVLLHKPGWVFMDEATSALDDKLQQSMMQLFDNELKGSSAISIAHRSGLDSFHHRTLSLVKAEGGAKLVTKKPEAPQRKRRRTAKFFSALGRQKDPD